MASIPVKQTTTAQVICEMANNRVSTIQETLDYIRTLSVQSWKDRNLELKNAIALQEHIKDRLIEQLEIVEQELKHAKKIAKNPIRG